MLPANSQEAGHRQRSQTIEIQQRGEQYTVREVQTLFLRL